MELSLAMAFGWHVREAALPLLRQLLEQMPPQELPTTIAGLLATITT